MRRLLRSARFVAMLVKEFVQMRRDRLTFAMMIGVPLMQLVLFGFAINTDPKGLPTVLRVADNSAARAHASCTRCENTGYFRHRRASVRARPRPTRLLERGEVQFVVTIPDGLHARRLCAASGRRCWSRPTPPIPAATSNAIAALATLRAHGARRTTSTARWRRCSRRAGPFELRIHRRYNPEGITQYNIVPGLMGVILTMTMVMITGLAMTRERERGTMENLLAMPVRPLEVMLGKIVPYIAGRLHPGRADPGRRAAAVRGADGRQPRCCCRWSLSSSSPPTWRWASPSRRSRRTSCRRCR